MLRRCGKVGLALWLVGAVAAAVATDRGVDAEPVELTLDDGTAISGTLFRPRHGGEAMAPAVVVHGFGLSHASCAPALALPLARHNVLTLAIDLPGHGRSGGSLPRRELDEIGETLKTVRRHPEVDAAIAFILGQPGLAESQRGRGAPCLTLVGHSLGGWVVTNVGHAREDVQNVVSLGAAPATCGPDRPRNLMILVGKRDPLCPPARGLEAIERATGGAVRGPRQSYGDADEGTRRYLVLLSRGDHFTELADPDVSRHALQWIGSSLHHDFGPVPGTWLLVAAAGVVVACAGGGLFSTWALELQARWLPPSAPPRGAGCRVGPLLVLLIVVTGVAPLVARVPRWVDVGPVYYAVPSLLLLSCVALACWAASWLAAGTPVAVPEPGVGAGWRPGLALGVVALGLGFFTFGIPWGLSWDLLYPGSGRVLLALLLWPALLPAALALAGSLQRLLGDGAASRRARLGGGLAWLGVPAALWAGQVLFTAGQWPLFTAPVGLLSASSLVALPLWLLPRRPGLTLARAVCHSAAAAWLLASHLPFVHGA